MDAFLLERIQTLDCLRDLLTPNSANRSNDKRVEAHFTNDATFDTSAQPTRTFSIMCPKQNHPLRSCPKFKQLSVADRFGNVKRHKVCINCLSRGHDLNSCTSRYSCSICNRKHHTLLHREDSRNPNSAIASNQPIAALEPAPLVTNPTFNRSGLSSAPQNSLPSTSCGAITNYVNHRQVFHSSQNRPVLLGTALVNIVHQGTAYPVRALIDPASEASFVTTRLQRQLKLATLTASAHISGINQSATATAKQKCLLTVGSPMDASVLLETEALILPNISGNLPSIHIGEDLASRLSELQLADRRLCDSRPVDILLGADLYPRIVKGEIRPVLETLLAQRTVFGWIVTGPVNTSAVNAFTTRVNSFDKKSFNITLSFSRIKDTPNKILHSPAD